MISNGSEATACLPEHLLPAFYMEDFSVLGLRVGNLDAAVELLEKSGVGISQNPGYKELSIENRDQIPHIVQMLNENDIDCVFADIAEQVYQG